MTMQMQLVAKRESERAVAQVVQSGVDRFIENFEVLVNVAGSTKQLKELILRCAVQGKLLPPGDETAESLVSELQRARAGLAGKGVRIGGPSEPVADHEIPYALPSGWRWVRLRDMGGFLGGGTPSKSNAAYWKGPLPWVSPKDMKRPYIEDAEDHISMAAVEGSAAKLIPVHSLLYVVRGMILAHSFPVAVATREVAINQDMKALVLAIPGMHDFVLRTLQAAKSRVLAKVERSSHGTCRLDSEIVELMPVALPPLSEQKRIVAKVERLMALCDDLEARQNKKREVGTRLTKSAFEALTTAEGPEEFDAAWSRAVENFDVLLGRTESIAAVRSTILELAVRGKLVAADSKSACAPSASRGSSETTAPPGPFELPAGWTWARVGDVFEVVGGIQKTPLRAPVANHYPYLRVENVQRGRLDLSRMERFELQPGELEKKRLLAGDILVVEGNGSENEIGRCALWDGSIENCVHQNHIIRCRPLGGTWSPFVLLFLNSPSGISEMKRLAITTSGLYSLSVGKIRGIDVPLPPPEQQRRIVEKVERLLHACDALEAKLRRAEERANKLVEAVVTEVVA